MFAPVMLEAPALPAIGLAVEPNPRSKKTTRAPATRPTDASCGYLRKLLVVGATSVIRRARTGDLAAAPWIRSLLERRPARAVTVAMANKTARIIWAVLTREEVYRPTAAYLNR
jgi:hypothetical protein